MRCCLLFKRRQKAEETALFALLWITLGGYVYLFASSLLARYALLIYPVTAASAGSLILEAASAIPMALVAAPVVAALLAVPSRSALLYYSQFSDVGYNAISAIMPSDPAALERQLGGYTEAEPLLAEKPWGESKDHNVLLVNADIQYYIELYGGEPIGDWMGKDRYSDFADAIDEGRVRRYINSHHVIAIVIDVHGGALVKPEIESLCLQLTRAGFTELSSSDASYVILKRTFPSRKTCAGAKCRVNGYRGPKGQATKVHTAATHAIQS